MNLHEIAVSLGVSPASISIVRKGKPGVSRHTRRLIEDALENNGFTYVPFEPVSQSFVDNILRNNRKFIQLIKFSRSGLLTDKNEGFVDGIIDAVDSTARALDYALSFCSISHSEYEDFLRYPPSPNCVGFIVIATEMSRNEILKLSCYNLPAVILDSDQPCLPFTTVTMNNRDLAFKAVESLKQCGEVGYLRSTIRTGNFIERENGYREAIRAFGLPDDDELIYNMNPSLNDASTRMAFILESGKRIPHALFADNDVIAIGAMRACIAHGLRIPKDLQIIGVDNTMLSQIVDPTLSTTKIPRSIMGTAAVEELAHSIIHPEAEKRHIRVATELVLRGSTTQNKNSDDL